MESNYISAEIEVLKSLQIEHAVYLYANGERLLSIFHKDKKWTVDYLEVQGFEIKNIQKTKYQYLIKF